jgi:hypothetical protein
MDANGPQLGGIRINPVHLMSETGQDQPYPEPFKFADDCAADDVSEFFFCSPPSR